MTLSNKPPLTDFEVAPPLAATIRAHLEADKLPCAAAFAIAQELRITPAEVGRAADALDIHLSRCQLGLFGYPQKQGWAEAGVITQAPPAGLEAALREAADTQGHLPCARLWALAQQFACSRMLVGYVADALQLKVVACQLGAF